MRCATMAGGLASLWQTSSHSDFLAMFSRRHWKSFAGKSLLLDTTTALVVRGNYDCSFWWSLQGTFNLLMATTRYCCGSSEATRCENEKGLPSALSQRALRQ